MAGPTPTPRSLPGLDTAETLAYDAQASTSAAALDTFAQPELAFVLVAAGMLCITLRLASPGLGWNAIVLGSSLLLIGGITLITLPVHVAGLLMFAFAAASLCTEVLAAPGFGLHAIGGGFSLVLAGVYLADDIPGAHPALVVPVSVAVAGITYLAGRRSWRCIRDRPLDPCPTLIGRGTVVLSAAGPLGHGVVSGQLWNLRAEKGDLRAGQTVRVTAAADHWLIVEPAPGLDVW
jgi:membrane-bound ClpP family serine protease